MPLCIAGMHRSGTSMISNLLYECGLYLGPEKDLLNANKWNAGEYWESRSFMDLNDDILTALGGSWDCPPPMDTPGWENSAILDRFRKQACKLVRRFRRREPWGWKDPRNSLTLPLWQSIIPNLKVLICVRNPLAVAESVRARDGMSLAAAFELWHTYNRRVLAAAPPESRFITHSESYLANPQTELRRVLEWLGLGTTEDRLERACARVKPELVHHRVTMDELVEAGASSELVQCYQQLCDLASSDLAFADH